MYLLFRYHHMSPKQYYEMGYGERKVLMAFMHYQIEQLNKEIENMKES